MNTSNILNKIINIKNYIQCAGQGGFEPQVIYEYNN